MRKRNRVTLFLIMPLVVFFWVFSWSLYWMGSNKKLSKLGKKSSGRQLVFTVLMPEQKYAKQSLEA